MAMMRGSLASLPRMSMDALNTREDADRALRIWLLSAVTREGGATYYKLAGRFQANGQTWEVLRRYSEFLALRSKLIKFLESADDDGDACPGCVNYLHAVKRFEFPKKHIFSSRNPAVVNYRVKALRSFMNLLASWAFSTAPKCPLCGGHAFELVRNFVVDGAEPVADSNMDYIRGSMSVDTFTASTGGERPSAFARQSLDRHQSWIPASRSSTLQQQQQQQQPGWNPSKSANNAVRSSAVRQQSWNPSASANNAGRASAARRQQQQQPDAYDTFNDYLPPRPSQRAKGSNTDTGPSNNKFGVQRPGAAQQSANANAPGGFLLYGDSASFGTPSIDATAAPSGSTAAAAATRNSSSNVSNKPAAITSNSRSNSNGSLKSAMRKHKNEPRNVARDGDNDSFVSFSSTVAPTSVAGVQHTNMLSSPNTQPHNAHYDSFASDSVVSFSVEPVSSEYAAQRGLPLSDDFADEHSHDDDDDDDDDNEDDEIDVTGLALASPPAAALRSTTSGENLWQPWELDRSG